MEICAFTIFCFFFLLDVYDKERILVSGKGKGEIFCCFDYQVWTVFLVRAISRWLGGLVRRKPNLKSTISSLLGIYILFQDTTFKTTFNPRTFRGQTLHAHKKQKFSENQAPPTPATAKKEKKKVTRNFHTTARSLLSSCSTQQ